MAWWEALLLIIGGLFAGAINTVAGGGSMLTVPLLVLAGVPGNAANGSNRVGILTSNVAAVATFRRLGVDGLRHASRVVVPVVLGGLIGSFAVGRVLSYLMSWIHFLHSCRENNRMENQLRLFHRPL